MDFEIETILASLESDLGDFSASTKKLDEALARSEDLYKGAAGLGQLVGTQVATRELLTAPFREALYVASFEHIRAFSPDSRMPTQIYRIEGGTLEVSQPEKFNLKSTTDGCADARPDCLFLLIPLQIIQGGQKRVVTISQEVFLSPNGRGTLEVVRLNAPRFFYDGSKAYLDFFSDIPSQNGLRERLRNELVDRLGAELGNLNLDTRPTYQIPFELQLLDCSAGRYVSVAFQTPLHQSPLPKEGVGATGEWSETLLLGIGPLTQAANKVAANMGAAVSGIILRNGFIDLGVSRVVKGGKCGINVTVDVLIEYAITLSKISEGTWRMIGNQVASRVSVDVDPCIWPICGKIKEKAQRTATDEIANYKRLDFEFFDLGNMVLRSDVQITDREMIVSMNRRPG